VVNAGAARFVPLDHVTALLSVTDEYWAATHFENQNGKYW